MIRVPSRWAIKLPEGLSMMLGTVGLTAALADQWHIDHLEAMIDEVGLDGLEDEIQQILAGKLARRVLVDLLE